MVVAPLKSKKKHGKSSSTTTAIVAWASMVVSIFICVWNNSISINRISSPSYSDFDYHYHYEDWKNQSLYRRSSTRTPLNVTTATTITPSVNVAPQIRPLSPLQLWYLPHMGHPWLEWLAAQHNLTWGACHFTKSPLYGPWCPQQHEKEESPVPPLPPHSRMLAWTWKLSAAQQPPPPENSIDVLSLNATLSTTTNSNDLKHVAVLRNPYHRLIDFYYYTVEHWGVQGEEEDEAEEDAENETTTDYWDGPCRTPKRRLDAKYYATSIELNGYLIRWLKKLRARPCFQDCLLLPQYEYIYSYDENKTRTIILVDHILHYEQLQQEWEQLARQYHLPHSMTQLPPTQTQHFLSQCRHLYQKINQSLFTEHDLSPTTLQLIHQIYAKDFVLGNYSKIAMKAYIWPVSHYHEASPLLPPHNTNGTLLFHATNNSNSNNMSLPRLELIHIPKTGGTMLELWAARSNITWGACHFEVPWKWRKNSELRHCPVDSVRDVNFYTDFPLWHAPRYMLQSHLPFDPYDNLQDESLRRRPPHYFVVIRNPYQRLISLFYMNFATSGGRKTTICLNDPKKLNIVLRRWFQMMVSSSGASINPTRQPYEPDKVCHHACAFLPQAHYILPPESLPPLSTHFRPRDVDQLLNTATIQSALSNRTSWRVQHILHLEQLDEELEALLKQHYPDYYHLLYEAQQHRQHVHSISSTSGTGSSGNRSKVVNANRCKTVLTVHDLDGTTLNQIHSLYALDFVLGGYPMMNISSLK